jgi:hypothetical protein
MLQSEAAEQHAQRISVQADRAPARSLSNKWDDILKDGIAIPARWG